MVIFVRSSCPKVFCRKGVLRNFANAIGNICARDLFLIKLHDGKNKLWHWCFPVNFVIKHNSYVHNYKPSHSATRRRSDVEATSLCTSKQRHRYVSNETPNDVLLERHQDVSVLHILDVASVCLLDVSNKSQMKHSMTSQWYVTKTFQWYVSLMSY